MHILIHIALIILAVSTSIIITVFFFKVVKEITTPKASEQHKKDIK